MKKPAIATMCFVALPSIGDAEQWEKSATIYGWLPSLNGSIETEFGDLDLGGSGNPSNVLSALDMVFMGTFEAGRGRWNLITDLIYVDLSSDKDTPFGVLLSDASADIKMWAASGYVSYSVHESENAAYDIAAGFRYFDLDINLGFGAGVLPGASATLNSSWVDPVVAVRGNWKLSDTWSATAFADGGGLADSSTTWQLLGTLNYSIDEKWAARFGYRHMEVSKEISNSDVELQLSGPVLGVAYRF